MLRCTRSFQDIPNLGLRVRVFLRWSAASHIKDSILKRAVKVPST